MKRYSFKASALFIFLLIALSFLYNYHKILSYPAYSIHTWRQSDCLSITTNYFQENLSFFTPKIHWTSENGDNKTISEFPIVYYTVAQLWKLFGQKYFIYRLIDILLVFIGLFSLFRLSYKYLSDYFWAAFVPLFLFTSPILVYYTNNFMADAPALGMAITGAYLFSGYLDRKHWGWLLLSIVAVSLAGLLKISSLILFTAYMAVSFFGLLGNILNKKAGLKSLFKEMLPFFVVISVMIVWYSYARYYTKMHNSGIFLQSIFPIWELDAAKRHEISQYLYFRLLPAYFNKKALALLLLMAIVASVVGYRKSKKIFLLYFTTLFGVFLYIMLWYKAFDVHDYYLTNLLVVIPFTLLVFLKQFQLKTIKWFSHWSVKAIATVAILVLAYQTTMINRIKYNAHDPWLKANVIMKKQEVDYWKYIHWEYETNRKAYETITPYLRSLGINRNDLVYSTPDQTINHTLYLMDQRGFTDFGYNDLLGDENLSKRIEHFKKIGCKYLMINNPEKVSKIDAELISNKIGEHKNIQIFMLDY